MTNTGKREFDYLWDAILDARYGPCYYRFLSPAEYREAAEELQRMAMAAR